MPGPQGERASLLRWFSFLALMVGSWASDTGPQGFGPIVNSSFTLFTASEDLTTNHDMYLSADDGLYMARSTAPTGSDTTLMIGSRLYLIFNNAGVPTCVYSAFGGSAPSSLFSLSPFYTVGPSTVLGRPTNHWRYETSKYLVGAQLDSSSGMLTSLSNPSLQGEFWNFYVFDNTSVSSDTFAVPAVCTNSSVITMEPYSHSLSKSGDAGGPPVTRKGLGLLRQAAAAAAADGRPAWEARESGGQARGKAIYQPLEAVLATLPTAVDNSPFAPPVRDQTSQCGGCWAFASVAATEVVANFNRGAVSNNSVGEHLSPQQVIDCVAMNESDSTALIDCKGCNGGWPFTGLRHIVEYGIASESSYPFAAVTGFDCLTSSEVSYPLKDVKYVQSKNATAMAAAVVEHGAVVGILNMQDGLGAYSSGVFKSQSCCSGTDKELGYCLQHAVTIVGFGTDEGDGTPFWLVKNSFGSSWGTQGYFRIARGNDTCGIEDNVVVPIAA